MIGNKSISRGENRALGGRLTEQLLQARMAKSTPTVLSKTILAENFSRVSSDGLKMPSTGKKK